MQAEEQKPSAIFLMGPTASGKTELAVALHERFPVDIVSVDSALVYRGMDIGTAKPDAETLQKAPHALIDIREPTQSYSAAEFRTDALVEMSKITTRGRVPLLTGGTMLYFRALSRGLAELPSANPNIREAIEAEAQKAGWRVMHARLAVKDPETAERIHYNDPQRIQRALEVIEITGRPMSELLKEQQENELGYRLLKIVACPQPRSVLHERIERRFRLMLEAGFLDEVRALHANPDLTPDLPAMRCVGYRQAWAWLDGEFDFETMCEKALAATRQLAKRQLTWLRQESGAMWYDPTVENAQKSVFREVGNLLG